MRRRQIPNLYITIQDGVDFNAIQTNPQVQNTIFNSLISGIKEASDRNQTEATIIELNSSGNYISINRSNWTQSLEKAQIYFSDMEEYEMCADIQKLIESIVSHGTKRLHRKTSRTDKSNNRSPKHPKTSKKN
jgi:nitrous oxide reductase accessory protein NosL